MRVDVTFTELKKEFTPSFGELYEASDGGYDKGYSEGYDKGVENGYSTGYTEGETKGKEIGYDEGYDKGVVDGRTQGIVESRQEFTDKQTGLASGRKDLSYCFQYSDHEELNIKNETITTLGYCFRGARTLKKITFLPNGTSKCTSFGYVFNTTPNLETIENLDLTSATSANQTFNSSGVKHITFTGTISFNLDLRAADGLTHDTLINVFNTLIDKTGGTTGTLYIGGKNLVKVSEEELSIVYGKNWEVY